MGIEFTRPAGGSVDQLLINLKTSLTTNQEDMLLVGNIVKSGIRERSAKGVDADEQGFAPYSTKGPYYYNPSTGGGKFPAPHVSVQKKSAARVHGLLSKHGITHQLSRTGTTIKFDSYAAFKAAFGRGGIVDLLGIDPPHMLDAMEVRAIGNDVASVTIGGEAAERASAHNEGEGRVPMRHFFAIAAADVERIIGVISQRLLSRIKG